MLSIYVLSLQLWRRTAQRSCSRFWWAAAPKSQRSPNCVWPPFRDSCPMRWCPRWGSEAQNSLFVHQTSDLSTVCRYLWEEPSVLIGFITLPRFLFPKKKYMSITSRSKIYTNIPEENVPTNVVFKIVVHRKPWGCFDIFKINLGFKTHGCCHFAVYPPQDCEVHFDMDVPDGLLRRVYTCLHVSLLTSSGAALDLSSGYFNKLNAWINAPDQYLIRQK